MLEILKKTFNNDFLYVIIMVISMILLGFICRKSSLFKEGAKGVISKFILYISLPCLAFTSFIQEFQVDRLVSASYILLFTSIIYVLFIILLNTFFKVLKKNNYKVYAVLSIVGQLSLFGLPVAASLFNETASLVGVVMTIPFRIVLYLYCYYVISNDKSISKKEMLKKLFLNPIVIMMFIGILFFVLQPITMINYNNETISFLRIDITVPYLYKVLSVISKITTPLAMFSIGLELGEFKFKEIFTNRLGILIAILKSLVVPLLFTGLLVLFRLIPGIEITKEQASSMIILFASPISAVLTTYCLNFKNEEELSSKASALSCVLSVVLLPIFVLLSNLIF